MRGIPIIQIPARKFLARRCFDKAVSAEGFDGSTSPARAQRLYRRAAVLGQRSAQCFLALSYAVGQFQCRNHRLALAWFRRAAFAGEELCALVVNRGPSSPDEQIAAFKRLLKQL